MMKKFLVLLLTCLLAATSSQAQERGGFDDHCPGMASLVGLGKGFLWNHNRIVTANHVAAVRSPLNWRVSNGEGCEAATVFVLPFMTWLLYVAAAILCV